MKWFALSAILAAGISGCAGYDLRYEPQGVPRPLVTAYTQRVFLGSFEDGAPDIRRTFQRGSDQPRDLGVETMRTPMGPLLKEGVAAELSRLGIQRVSVRQDAERVLTATVMAAAVEVIDDGQPLALQKASLTILATMYDMAGRKIQEEKILGVGELRRFGLERTTRNMIMNAAIANAVARFRIFFEPRSSAPAPSVAEAVEPPASRTETSESSALPAVARTDIDDLPAVGPQRAAHAIVIGIERYREKLPEAEFAAGDARLAAQYFERVLGVPEENVALLLDDRAAKSDFEKYFERWLPNRVQKGDDVYVYYSGHGAPNPKNGDSYLVPYDADPTYIAETGYPVQRLYAKLAKLPAGKITVVLDSCFSGAGGRSVIARGARPLVSVRESDVPANLIVIAAAGGDQISNTYDAKGHGLFTYFFLKGIKEKGADLREAFEYAKPEVSKIARRELNADQDPQWRQGQ